MNTRYIPFYIFGDSHVLPFQNSLVTDDITSVTFVAKTKFSPGFRADEFWRGADLGLNSALVEFLNYEGLVRDGVSFHLSKDERHFNAASAATVPLMVPLIMFCCGDIDIRTKLLPLLKDKYDVVPPFESPYSTTGAPLFPWDEFKLIVDSIIDPLIEGLSHLLQAGFGRIFLQGIVPPTLDTKRFLDLHGFDCPKEVRYKVVSAFNAILTERCKPLNFEVIDVWGETTENGFLKSEFELDGVHLTPAGSALSFPIVFEKAINRSGLGTNFVRYELYYERARSEFSFDRV